MVIEFWKLETLNDKSYNFEVSVHVYEWNRKDAKCNEGWNWWGIPEILISYKEYRGVEGLCIADEH